MLMQFVFPTSQTRHYSFPTHVNDLVVDRADAATSEVFLVVLAPGQAHLDAVLAASFHPK